MVRINLLPHREARRKERRTAFVAMLIAAVFVGGLVTYSNESKAKLIGVKAETLAAHGAVSEATVREMAEGARTVLGADYGMAVTGTAGPAGGTAEKPVGTVWIGLAIANKTLALRQFNAYDRETFKYVTSQQALNVLRRMLRELKS